MAVVYKAKRQGPAGFEKTVVVKLMLPGLITRTELVDLFRAEAKLSAQLTHPNIVQVHDFGVVDGVPFLVMEYLDGRNLTQLRTALGDNGKIPLGAALAIARDMCHALGYAHDFVDPEGKRRQIIHRDVSPSNVMLCRDGMVKLLDFGVAKVAGQFESEVTQSFRGKYAYMAPEQVNRQAIDRRVDVFAAGIVLHEMLTGKRLFAAPSELETLERVAQARVIAPSVDNSEVPRKLDALVKKALSLNPNDRFSSGAEMAEAIEELNGKAWNRRKLMGWLTQLFPKDFTVTCEVCGKQVVPGESCGECGTESPAQDMEIAPRSVASIPAIDSGPLPLPPPPASTPSGRVLSIVREQEAAKVEGSEALDQMSELAPAPRDSFEPNQIDKTPVDAGPSLAKDELEPVSGVLPRTQSFDSPSTTRSTTRPKLFVVKDDSVRMGLPRDTRVMEPPTSQQSRPTVVATPRPHHPPTAQLAPRLSTRTTRPMPTVDAPDLRPSGSGWKLAFALLIGGGVAALMAMVFVSATPHKSEPVAVPIVGEAPRPVVTAPVEAPRPVSAPIVQQAPVVVTAPAPPVEAPKPVVVEAKPAPKPVVEEAAPPAKPVVSRAPAKKRVVVRHRSAEPAAPKPTIREGRIVDPFAGSD
jgi:serine/threonine-protein kinase